LKYYAEYLYTNAYRIGLVGQGGCFSCLSHWDVGTSPGFI